MWALYSHSQQQHLNRLHSLDSQRKKKINQQEMLGLSITKAKLCDKNGSLVRAHSPLPKQRNIEMSHEYQISQPKYQQRQPQPRFSNQPLPSNASKFSSDLPEYIDHKDKNYKYNQNRPASISKAITATGKHSDLPQETNRSIVKHRHHGISNGSKFGKKEYEKLGDDKGMESDVEPSEEDDLAMFDQCERQIRDHLETEAKYKIWKQDQVPKEEKEIRQLYKESCELLSRYQGPTQNNATQEPTWFDRLGFEAYDEISEETWQDPIANLIETKKLELQKQEIRLMIERWKTLWEEVRGPRPQWYERRDASFFKELQKNQRMLTDPSSQSTEHLCQQQMMEFCFSLSSSRLKEKSKLV